ncbi:MAG: ABC transporter permease [Candidatus Pseudobacter hemicellulosilyticus]|uniref:ABC transporter permease n=1 Tax=Candidatus Pseudobacter hemicellulosilyticus TaxID=3121375 RepID=A0AAJ5WSF2_9BACT|nr:MAG: ABC transporter permease [Pseudobacter sp.]
MLRNYLLIALRNLWKNKSFTAINITGLSVGMASAILILLWIQNEWSMDKFHEKDQRLFQVWNQTEGETYGWNSTPKILGPTLKQEFPDIQQICRMQNIYGALAIVGDNKLKVNGQFVDSTFLSMFSFPLVQGNPGTALRDPNNILLTESLARKLFGSTDVIGKIVQIHTGESKDQLTVSGLLKDLPNNSSLKFECLMPWSYMAKIGWDDNYWGNNSVDTYVELQPAASLAAVNKKIRDITRRHTQNKEPIDVFLYSFSSAWLYGNLQNGLPTGGRIEMVRLFAIIAGFILLIACINFMNLSTARSEKRAREVGIRKVVGARRGSLVAQFLGESILLSLGAGLIALLLVQLTLPAYNQLVGKKLFIPFGTPGFLLSALGFVLITGLVAGSYPAFYLSAFRPIRVLKGSFKQAGALITPRKILVITQFSFAIILIICTIIVRQQIRYAQERDAGYNKDNLVYVFGTADVEKHYALIIHELTNAGAITSASKTSSPLSDGWSNTWGIQWEGKRTDDRTVFERYCTDGNLVKTAGFHLVRGRDIDVQQYPTDSLACLLNEKAVAHMGFKDPIGKIVKDNNKDWVVVGVIKDFIIGSPYQTVTPMLIEGPKGWFNAVHFRLNEAKSTADCLAILKNVFEKYNPDFPFEYYFLNEDYAQKFRAEQQSATLAGLFAGLTILISCLGLFGLATYMAENRVKEIGVRKVLGASVLDITSLLSRDFLRLVVVALLIATPLAWWFMHQWLQDYRYRISISVWVFIGAGALSILIALLTVSYKSIRAAMANPALSLRSE